MGLYSDFKFIQLGRRRIYGKIILKNMTSKLPSVWDSTLTNNPRSAKSLLL